MHEIKSPFLILMEEQSYLAQSLESAFEKQDVKVKIVTIAEASSIVISEKPSGYLICTSPELLKKAVSVKVMVDQAIKNKTPVFIMGNIDELELLWETLPQQMVMDVFTRPITVGDMVDNVCTQMNDFYQLKKRTILAVDDSGIILRKIKALLEDTYQVVLANSGAMAIKYLTLNTPDLILLDYAMPIVDGSQIMHVNFHVILNRTILNYLIRSLISGVWNNYIDMPEMIICSVYPRFYFLCLCSICYKCLQILRCDIKCRHKCIQLCLTCRCNRKLRSLSCKCATDSLSDSSCRSIY